MMSVSPFADALMMTSPQSADEHFMLLAMREAEKARAAGEVPCGCVIVKDNRVIARGWNQVEALKDATAHAEMLALTAAEAAVGDWRLEGCTVYVTKEPCPMCAGAAINARLPRVVFGAYDRRAGSFGSLINLAGYPYNHRPNLSGGVCEDEAKAMIQGFFEQRRKK